ncbi:OLC1v1019833C4 [Oldenlandia corymbosa var. corymbosa]|uniref:OLC1v1019833C4 n=1 Tax=Oldenlandia corymbosa var. corymbosa TaxID=529605 RepID=A0AAV1EFC9_OLDCO|nr:OLC1v1019833C4 [Oldenlandia corymbosa var. corymbosa]
MMSADNQNMDLGLALGYSSNCTKIRGNGNSGAGVNAGSSVNLKFPASDSLSELVWSPQRGLSLKCAEGSLPNKKAFLLWNVDPSPSESISCKEIDDDDDKIVAGNLVISNKELHVDSEVAPTTGLIESTRIVSSIPVIDLGLSVMNLSQRGPPDSNCGLAEAESSSMNLNKDSPADLNPTNDNAIIPYRVPLQDTTAVEGYTDEQSEPHLSPLQTLPWLDIQTEELKSANNEQEKNTSCTRGDMMPCGEKLEYTAENYLACTNDKSAYDQNKEKNKGIVVRGCSLPIDPDAENRSSYFHCLKSKNKALSEGNSSRRLLDNGDDSQESLESCNSAGLIGKKRLNLNEQFVVESKRMKTDVEGNIASTSRHGSSFMNWISNVVSGCSNPNHEDSPSLELTLAHSSHDDKSTFQDNIVCSRLQDPKSENMGFQTLFQSLYCPRTKLLKSGTSENYSAPQGPHVVVQVDDTAGHISTKRFSEQNGASCNPNDISDGKILPSTVEDVVGKSDKALVLYRNAAMWNDFKTGSAVDKGSNDQECGKHGNETSASVSQADQKISLRNEGDPQLACDGRATGQLSKVKMPGSLWITRFITKVGSTQLILDNATKEDCLADGLTTQNPQTQISQGFPMEGRCPHSRNKSHKNLARRDKELQTYAADAESSLDSKKMQENNHENVVVKLNSVQASHKSRCSEAMASTFARRFNALKHITPTAEETITSSRLPTSFSGGKRCHVRTCSKATETELVEIASNHRNSCFVEKEENLKAAAYKGEKTCINASQEFLVKESSRNRSFSSNETNNQFKSNSRENKTSNCRNVPLVDLVSINIGDIPKGVFDAVRRLRLSRADMLKWIGSNVSLSLLEGLFLRLRLGRSEAGLDGTGYYVARILGIYIWSISI